MKETQKIWRIGKTAALLLLAVLLTCAVIVPAAAEDSSAVFTQQEIQGMMTAGSVFSDVFDNALYNSLSDDAKANYMATVLGSLSGPAGSTPALDEQCCRITVRECEPAGAGCISDADQQYFAAV